MDSRLIKATASSIVLGAALIGCTTSPSKRPVSAAAGSDAGYRQAERAHERAVKAVQKGDLSGAIASMEQAVGMSPQDAGYRKTLAELYLKSGRFTSAEATYADVVTLNPGDSKAGFFLAISQLAQGRTAAALVQLDAVQATADPADLGLAYALAGQMTRALALLEPAARAVTATARVRQNLALAYALAGDWKNARLVAEQDLAPSDLNRRLEQWAALASSGAPETRVGVMLGVSAASDPGRPAHLALAPAAVTVASGEVNAESADVEAETHVATQATSLTEVEIPAIVAPIAAAATTDKPAIIVPAAVPAFSPPQPIAPRRLARPAVAKPAARATSRYVVQIGAFQSADQVGRGWTSLNRRHPIIARYAPQSTSVTIAGKGVFHRLSIAGFESDAAAASVCRTIKVQGGSCFVRLNAGDAPIRIAARNSKRA